MKQDKNEQLYTYEKKNKKKKEITHTANYRQILSSGNF